MQKGKFLEDRWSQDWIGVLFQIPRVRLHTANRRKRHGDYISENAHRSLSAILKSLKTRGGHYIPAILKLFKAKVNNSATFLWYPAGSLSNFLPLGLAQSKCLKMILQVPKCVSNIILRLETSLMKVEARVWVTILKYWLKLPPHVSLTMRDDFQSTWKKIVATKISSLAFSPGFLLRMGYDQAKAPVKQHVATGPSQASNLYCQWIQQILCLPYDILNLKVLNHRKVFMIQCPPLSCHEDWYRKILYPERQCLWLHTESTEIFPLASSLCFCIKIHAS